MMHYVALFDLWLSGALAVFSFVDWREGERWYIISISGALSALCLASSLAVL